jgi:hypothetical protein
MSAWSKADMCGATNLQFFGGPCEIRLDCLGEFFFRRLLQVSGHSLDVFPPGAFAGVVDETRAIGIASDLCGL